MHTTFKVAFSTRYRVWFAVPAVLESPAFVRLETETFPTLEAAGGKATELNRLLGDIDRA